MKEYKFSCCPREGRGLHLSRAAGGAAVQGGVAVPVRGAGCILLGIVLQKKEVTSCCPREGRGLHPTTLQTIMY